MLFPVPTMVSPFQRFCCEWFFGRCTVAISHLNLIMAAKMFGQKTGNWCIMGILIVKSNLAIHFIFVPSEILPVGISTRGVYLSTCICVVSG